MTLWPRVRGWIAILGAIVGSLVLLALPTSELTAVVSPIGAPVPAAALIGLIVPVVVAWSCTRGDPVLERVSVRPIPTFDLVHAVAAVGMFAVLALGEDLVGLSPAGSAAARNAVGYLGMSLIVATFAGWARAGIAPTVFILVAAIFGADSNGQASWWAWIAADGIEGWSWAIPIALVFAGATIYLVVPSGAAPAPSDD